MSHVHGGRVAPNASKGAQERVKWGVWILCMTQHWAESLLNTGVERGREVVDRDVRMCATHPSPRKIEALRDRWAGQPEKKNICYTEFLEADWKSLLKEKDEAAVEDELKRMLELPE